MSRLEIIPLGGIGWAEIEGLQPGQRLAASFHGTDRKGEPTCATVKTLTAWKAVSKMRKRRSVTSDSVQKNCWIPCTHSK